MHHFSNGQLAFYTIICVVAGVAFGLLVASYYVGKAVDVLKETISRKDELIRTLDNTNSEVKSGMVQSHATSKTVAVGHATKKES